jgi:hypothetical protein
MPTEPDQLNGGDAGVIYRLELLQPILTKVEWCTSESVYCRRGSSLQTLRLIKRYHRIATIIEVRAESSRYASTVVLPQVVSGSRYAATLGVRLLLNGHVHELCAPFGEFEDLKVEPEPVKPEKAPRARARARVKI